MSVAVSEKNGVVTISLHGDLVFKEHRAFRDAYKHRPSNICYVVDFKHTRHIDSSALGMLLMLKEHNGNPAKDRIKLVNCNVQIYKIFEIAQFSEIFIIE
ncbi:MAG: STAS domain-containing protein [Magnetococcus sp. YQC-5]